MSQHSDNTKLTTLILNGNKNYIPWSRSVTIGLGGKGKLPFVTGTKERPKPKKPEEATAAETAQIDEWDTTDQMIMSWLLSTMDPKISNVLMYSKTSKEIWDKARKRYGQTKNFAHIFSLKQEISKIRQGNLSNNDLVTEIMSKWEELNIYLPPTTDPNEIQKRTEHDLIFTYLGALDPSYEAVRSQILASVEMPSFDDVVSRIEQEQSRRSLMNSHQSETTENQAFKTNHNRNPNPRGPAKTKGAAATDWCDHCKRAGHNREGCWVLHPHLRPVRNKGGWGGGKKEAYSGLSKGPDQVNEGGESAGIKSEPTKGAELSGSSVAPTAQLAHLKKVALHT